MHGIDKGRQKSFKKAHMKRGLFQGFRKYFAGIARKLWDVLLFLSPSLALPPYHKQYCHSHSKMKPALWSVYMTF